MVFEIEANYPVKIRTGGVVFLNNAFLEASMTDSATLIPMAFLIILIISYALLRSIVGVLSVLVVCILSILFAMGSGGWMGIGLTPPSASAPIIIVTLAVADSIHLLVSALNRMRAGYTQRDSILYSMRVNFKPVFLTSLTTAVGFLSLNFSDSPPFHDLGNISAIGVMAAWLYSITLLPILVSFLPLGKPKNTIKTLDSLMTRVGTFIADRYKAVLTVGVVASIGIISLIPLNEINDDFVKYFDESTEYRQDVDWISGNLTGVNIAQFSFPSGEPNGVSAPAFLEKVARFADWSRAQDEVTNVIAISDIFKRLNRDLNLGNSDYYTIPESRELAAQYLLLYELSLPFGLDLNNQLDINKSSTQVIVTLKDMTTNEMQAWIKTAERFIYDDASIELKAVGPTVMFAYISERNIESMLTGTIVAIFIISGLILIALRDVRLGLISLVPNLLPIALAFGVWGLLVGQVNLAVSVVTGLALGIVVDDSVHFLSKYQLARKELGLNAREAVISAFTAVGTALVVTTIILVAGFSVLAQSTFGLNSITATLTGIAISIALIADLSLLPALLISLDKDGKKPVSNDTNANLNSSIESNAAT
jgi:predicted RND superfamily exporter protein